MSEYISTIIITSNLLKTRKSHNKIVELSKPYYLLLNI